MSNALVPASAMAPAAPAPIRKLRRLKYRFLGVISDEPILGSFLDMSPLNTNNLSSLMGRGRESYKKVAERRRYGTGTRESRPTINDLGPTWVAWGQRC